MVENSKQNTDKELSSKLDEKKEPRMGLDLVDIFRKIIGIRKKMYKAAGIGVLIGIIVALSIPKQYTVKVTLSPEMGNTKSNGLAGLAASFLGNGANMGEGVDALNASLSSDIVSSTPFLLELLKMKIDVPVEKANTTLEDYLDEQSSPWWNYVIGMPGMIIGGVKSLFSDENKNVIAGKMDQTTIILTRDEFDKLNLLRKAITASVNNKTAITNIAVTLQEPVIATIVADSVVHKLQEYIISYRTSKAIDDCTYLEKLFKERQEEHYIAQKKYADYVDAHDNLILQSVRTEQERLQNDRSLAYQVYSQVANQLQVARAKVQEEKPVFAVVEPAVIPLETSGMGIKVSVLLFVFLSIFFVIGWDLFGKEIWNRLKMDIRKGN